MILRQNPYKSGIEKGKEAMNLVREQETFPPYWDFTVKEHIRNLTREIELFRKSQEDDPINATVDPISKFPDPITQQLYQTL